MGTCYSGLGAKSSSAQSPTDPKAKPIVPEKSCESEKKSKSSQGFDCKQLSESFENLSISEVKAKNDKKKRNKYSMSSQTNRQKIPIPSSKPMTNNKVVPKGSQEFVFNKYKTRRYEAPMDVINKVMIFDNSSTTSISSDCSINLSKCSLKSTSSSTSNIARPQTSIPKAGQSRTPTPPIPMKYSANVRPKGSQSQSQLQSSDRSNRMSDRLNGNEVFNKTDVKSTKNKSSISSELSNAPKCNYAPTYGTSIKYTTQMSGLPRPQTAHIVSTSSHSSDHKTINHKINACNDVDTRLNQYSDNKTQNSKCDQNLRQLKLYYYGMNKPYERPNTSNAFNYNRLQFQSQNPNPNTNSNLNPNQTKPSIGSALNSQNINQKQNSFAPNGPVVKPHPGFGSTYSKGIKNSFVKRDETSNKNINSLSSDDKNQSKSNTKSETNEDINHIKSNENTFLPKSIQRVREFVRKDLKNRESIEKPVQSSPEHNSISSVGANSESDNRDFLIDDEISDQPELVLSSNVNKNDLMKNLNSELEGLILKQELSVSPSTPSSPYVSLSNASSTSTIVPNTTTFRKPRPLSLVEMADGSFGLDSPSFRAACQDLIGIKTLLFRLHGLLQNAETINPFEHNYSQNKFYHQMMIAEDTDGIQPKANDSEDLQRENLDLKRQIVLQQQIIEDKDRTIRLLQQQMAKYSNINSAYVSQNTVSDKVNASSQTDRCGNASNINPRAVSDGSNGMLVSVCCSHIFDNKSKDPNNSDKRQL